MGFLAKQNQKTKNREKEKNDEFNKRLNEFVEKIKQATIEHRITFRPYIGKYGAEVEFYDVPKKSNIIIPK